MEKDNIIYRDSDFFTISDGKTNHYGVEASVEMALRSNLNLHIAATYARHRFANNQQIGTTTIDNNDVDSAPRFFSSAQLSWQASETLHLELDWQHMGEYYTDPENHHDYPGHDVLNLRSTLKIGNQTLLSVNILNLLDTRYAKRADYTSFTGERYFPGEPISLSAGIAYRW